jgi:hypothetical protein
MTQIAVDGRAFSGALQAAKIAVSKDSGGQSLNSLQLRYTNAALLIVGCDASRLHLASVSARAVGKGKIGGSALLAGAQVEKVFAALKAKKGDITLSFGMDALLIDGARVASLDAKTAYVDWEKPLEAAKASPRGMVLDLERPHFLSLLEKVAPLASDEPEGAVYFVADGVAPYLCVRTSGGPLFLPIFGKVSGDCFSFAMKLDYLRDALQSVKGARFSASIEGPKKPLLFKDGDFSGLLMPCNREAPKMAKSATKSTKKSGVVAARIEPQCEPPKPKQAAPRVVIDAVSPCEAVPAPAAPTASETRTAPQLSRADLSEWALDYVATLVSQNPDAKPRLQKSLDFQLGQLGTLAPAQWKERARAAFDAKVAAPKTAAKTTA